MLLLHIGRCRVTVHFTCFLLLAFCCLFAGPGRGAAVFLASCVHEAGHLIGMWLFGVRPEAVSFSALGCRIVLPESAPLPPKRMAAIALWGPGVNLLTFLLLWSLSLGGTPLGLASLALGALHSLPVEPLDGGLALRALLGIFFGEERARLIARLVAAALHMPLLLLGMVLLLRSRYNFSLLALSLYLMLYLLLGKDYLPD